MAAQKGVRAATRANAKLRLASIAMAALLAITGGARADHWPPQPDDESERPIVIAAAEAGWTLRPTLSQGGVIHQEPVLHEASLREASLQRSLPENLTMFSMADVLRQRTHNAMAPRAILASAKGDDLFGGTSLHLRGALPGFQDIGIMAEFGSRAIRVARTAGSSKWDAMNERAARDTSLLDQCARSRAACPTTALRHWHDIVESARDVDELSKARIVNRLINDGWRYRTDEEAFHAADYWASPAEFLARGGDCEDFAIAKWWTLKTLGLASDRMRILVVRDHERHAYHAVLSVKIAGRDIILDNLHPLAYDATTRHTYTAIASYGTGGTWVHEQRVASR